ncbi:MAG: hypothetical protein IT337_15455 [Thermomicrobiales bacterium]|nr:hypothetical protein [Thermomicrobiales bacterium]
MMAWVKLDDQFHDHPKVIDAGPLAEALYFRGLTYATRFLTDGFVPMGYLRRMGDLDALAEAKRLVACGLWDEVEGGYQIHDYLDYQPSKARVLADRGKNAQRQEAWRARNRGESVTPDEPPAQPTPTDDVTTGDVDDDNTGRNGVRNAVTNDSVTGAPSRPVPGGATPPLTPPAAAPPPRTTVESEPPRPPGDPPRLRSVPKPPLDPEGAPPEEPPVAAAAQPYDVLEALCAELGLDAAVLERPERARQLAVAKRLLRVGMGPPEVRGVVRWLAGQRWVQEGGGGIDLFLVEKQATRWKLAGRPTGPALATLSPNSAKQNRVVL